MSRDADHEAQRAHSGAPWLVLALFLAAAASAAACTPSIGDKCVISTDCSIRNDRICDITQPNGYCTIPSCGRNTCPDNAACILFHPTQQGCSFDDRTPSPTGRSYCMAQCSSDSDCRAGYVCRNPIGVAPWFALGLDDDQSKSVCIVPPTTDGGLAFDPNAPVCGPGGPPDGGIDVSTPDAGDASGDAPSDAADAGASDAADAAD
jgi:hypothetical protein